MERYLIDTVCKKTYLLEGDRVFIVSGASVRSENSLVIPPASEDDVYSLEVKGDLPTLNLIEGECCVNGEYLETLSPCILVDGTFLTLGSARALQYVTSDSRHSPLSHSDGTGSRRILPPTPGKSLDPSPPTKPRRHNQQYQHNTSASKPSCDGGDVLDPDIRPQLQRISAEVSARLTDYEGRKPPPPYEQVGNSIGYQLLHQQQCKLVTSELIDALYPILKENEMNDPSLLQSYFTYLQSFKQSLEQAASPKLMLPADLPTLDFIVDILLHLCCMPHMTAFAEKQGEVWCHLLALFSHSQQNQLYMTYKRHPTRVLSCMHLNIMSAKVRFQEYGWTVLANTVNTPMPMGGKPVLSESSLSLALSLTESQLATYSTDLPLVVAIVSFLAQVATAAKTSVSHIKKEKPYTEEQGIRIIKLFGEKCVLKHVMKVPHHLRSDHSFEKPYSCLVKALVPTRSHISKAKKRDQSCHATSEQKERSLEVAQQRATQLVASSPSNYGKDKQLPSFHQSILETAQNHNNVFCKSSSISLNKKEKFEVSKSSSCSNLFDHCDSTVYSDKTSGRSNDTEFYRISNFVVNKLDEATLISETVAVSTKFEELPCSSDSLNEKDASSSSHNAIFPSAPLAVPKTVQSPLELPLSDNPTQTCSSLSQSPQAHSPPLPLQKSISPPMTPNVTNLAQDVQNLLDDLKTPLQLNSDESVAVPNLSSNIRYYRHSLKSKSLKLKISSSKDLHKSLDTAISSENATSRQHWGDAIPFLSMLSHNFTLPGEVLSSQHSAVEEVTSGHVDILHALLMRVELLDAVLLMWAQGKGLQAATNLLQGCFSKDIDDVALFVDTLQCFLSHQFSWTLAVCFVLLPPLRQLITSQLQQNFRNLKVISDVVHTIVQRFSDLILACRVSPSKQHFRLSSSVDLEQQLVCYKELQCMYYGLTQRLDANIDSTETMDILQSVHTVLGQFI